MTIATRLTPAPLERSAVRGTMRRRTVLVSAYSCSPSRGSEPGIGWNWVVEHARANDVWVITSREFEQEIRAHTATHPMPNVHWTFHDVGARMRPWHRSTFVQHLHYYAWQLTAYRVAKRLHEQVGFDVLHHATLTIYWRPSSLALIAAPLVWGPLGGAELAPKPLKRTLGARARVFETVRAGAQALSQWDPFLRFTARRSTLALGATDETVARLSQMGASDVRILESVGMTDAELARLAALPARETGPFRVLSAGVLVGWKGFHLGIDAFARLRRERGIGEYWILGDGPERETLEARARALGIADHVRFWGTVTRDRVLQILAECDVMLHPSMHDSGCYATLEAMAAGRPVICLDVGGPARQITHETGMKVRVADADQVVDDLGAALLRLCDDAALRSAQGAAARRRAAEHFSWRRKSETIDAVLSSARVNSAVGAGHAHHSVVT